VVERHKLRDVFKLDYSIRKIYEETHSALCTDMPILAGVRMMMLIEVVCRNKEAKVGSLEAKIDNPLSIFVYIVVASSRIGTVVGATRIYIVPNWDDLLLVCVLRHPQTGDN
jgi:hypothetical protein